MLAVVGQLSRMLTAGWIPPVAVMKRSLLGCVLAAVLLVTAYVAFVFALWFYVAESNGPVYASLAVGVVMIVLAAVVSAGIGLFNRLARRRARIEGRMRAATLQAGLNDAAVAVLPLVLSKHPIATLVAVSGVAYALTRYQGRGGRR